MSAVALLERATAAGISLQLIGDRLIWEADHKPPVELLDDLEKQKTKVVSVLKVSGTVSAAAWAWLILLANQLECPPEYLLEKRFINRDDLLEQYQKPPSLADHLTRSNPNWQPPSKHSSSEEVVLGEQCAAKPAESAHTPEWLAARDAFHTHALGNCSHCHPPLGRYCTTGLELRARYLHETQAQGGHDE